jgi:propanol-preferring alcohol dehydrogenase
LGAQIALALGAQVYVADISEQALEAARALGVSGASHDVRDYESEGLDVIIDFAGYGTTTAAAIDAIRPGGRVVQIGLATEMATISTQKMTMKEITYVGASGAGTREGREVLELMASGAIKSEVNRITFDEIPAKLGALAKGGSQGRFVAFLD